MTIINTYTDNQLADLIYNKFGSNLVSLNLDEQLYLLQACVCYIGDAEEEMQDDAIEAAKQIEKTTDRPVEAMALILGLGDLLDDRVSKPISNYVTNWWSDAAQEAFGASLENMSVTEKAWNLYSLLLEIVDHDEISSGDEIDEIDAWVLTACEYGFEQRELILVARAIAHIAVESFYGNTSVA